VQYPHGLCFTPDGRSLLVADAGAPFVQVFTAPDGDWSGERRPGGSIRVLGDTLFRQGRSNAAEGGPKGIDLSPDGRVLAVTCQQAPLAFFDVADVLEIGEPDLRRSTEEFEAAREALVRHLVAARAGARDTVAAAGRSSDRELQNLLNSRSWRVTAPLRRLSASLQQAAAMRRLHQAEELRLNLSIVDFPGT
jgi:hypothetical protein